MIVFLLHVRLLKHRVPALMPKYATLGTKQVECEFSRTVKIHVLLPASLETCHNHYRKKLGL